MIVPIGMLVNVTSDDEIAAMTAHELSHVLLNHFQRVEDQIKNDSILSNAAVLAETASKFIPNNAIDSVDLSLVNQAFGVQGNGGLSNQILVAKTLLSGVTNSVWYPAWERVQEQEADYLAADLMASAGFSLKGFRNALKRLEDSQGKMASFSDALINEQQTIGTGISDITQKEVRNLARRHNLNASAYSAKQAGINLGIKVGLGLLEQQQAEAEKTHTDPKERLSTNRAYWGREYKTVRSKGLSVNNIQQALAQKDAVAAIKGNELAFAALKMLNEGKIKDAEKFAQKAVKSDAVSPKPKYVLALVRKAQHKNNLAIQELQSIQHWDGLSLSAYHDATNILMNSGKINEALTMIDRAEQRGWKEDFAYQKVAAYSKLNDDAQSQAAFNQCMGFKQAKSDCKKSFGHRYKHSIF